MRKRDELSRPDSCMSRARQDEMVFVLLSRDAAAPETIRYWANQRVRLGKNKPDDAQIVEAMACAAVMELEKREASLISRINGDGHSVAVHNSLMEELAEVQVEMMAIECSPLHCSTAKE